jgi:hypothetical protein
MNWRPNKWIAGALGLLAQPLGLLYVARPGWAVVYLPVLCAVGYVKLAFPSGAVPNLIPDVLGAKVAVLAADHAVYIATHAEVKSPRTGYTRWYGLAGCVAGFLALIFLLRFRVLTSGSRGTTVNSASIRPTRCLARTARDPA